MKKKILGLILFVGLLMASFGVASADEVWDLKGTYTIDFVCTSGCGGTYTHYMVIDTMDLVTGDFSGTGNYQPGTPTWTTEGSVDGSDVSFRIEYDSSSYYVDIVGTIASDGTMLGTASNASQAFDWSTTAGAATFQRTAGIVKPEEDEYIHGQLDLEAYLVDNDEDFINWAVRYNTCDAATNTVFGNVDGYHDSLVMTHDSENYTYSYSASTDTTSWVPGRYCFVFNPAEDAGETGIRETRWFYIADRFVKGGGQIIEDQGEGEKPLKISFGGQIWDLGADGYVGDWEVNFHNVGIFGDTNDLDKTKFHTESISVMNFYVGDSDSCQAALNFTALGRFGNDHESEYKLIFRAGDCIEPGHHNESLDTVRVQLFDPNGTEVYDTYDDGYTSVSDCVGSARTGLDHGNITIGL